MGLGGVWLWGPREPVDESPGLGSGSLGKNSLTPFTSLGLGFIICKMRGLNQNLFGGSCQLPYGGSLDVHGGIS